MLRRKSPACYKHMLLPNSDTESDEDVAVVGKNNGKKIIVNKDADRNKGKEIMVDKATEKNKGKKKMVDEEKRKGKETMVDHRGPDLVAVAKEYQRYMKNTPIPKGRVPFGVAFNWLDSAQTLKTFYGQHLHYLTLKMCKEWDQLRLESKYENKPLDSIIQWNNIESTIWKVEETHRLCTSPYYLATLWEADPEYRAFVDEVIPSR